MVATLRPGVKPFVFERPVIPSCQRSTTLGTSTKHLQHPSRVQTIEGAAVVASQCNNYPTAATVQIFANIRHKRKNLAKIRSEKKTEKVPKAEKNRQDTVRFGAVIKRI